MPTIPLFVTCPRGVEPLLAAELAQLGALSTKERPGGIGCEGTLEAAYRACLWSRLASRVLMPLKTFPIAGPDSLYEAALQIHWAELFEGTRTFAIEVAGHSAAVTHTHYAGLKIKDAICDQFRERSGMRPDVDTEAPDIRVHLHLEQAQATISLDLAGESLHQRGYRERSVEAPLKENLAAAILLRSGWSELAREPDAPLLDPMCGSGTLVIEAALIAADVAPALGRGRFGFEAWRGHDPALWAGLRAEAQARRERGLTGLQARFHGFDLDPRALKAARRNAQNAGVGPHTQWTQLDASQARPVGARPGLLVCNPPYGERLGAEAEVIKLYSLLGATLKQHFAGWRAAIFTARADLAPRLGLRADRIHALYNGALPCKLLNFTVPAPVVAGSASAAGGEEFANRLRKNLRHLSKWARRSGVSCYRLYDGDLPEYAVLVDLYHTPELHVHVQEYAAPSTVDPVRAEKHLREALSQISQVLEVPSARLHFKIRRSQKGTAQYQKQDEAGEFHEIGEHGCKLLVNFEDYLDTGLFLDHRPLRLRIQQEAAGKSFLNLFGYTGSATAHAARGGATRTVTVDLSNTYLDWAARNLRLNGFQAAEAGTFRDRQEQRSTLYTRSTRRPAPRAERIRVIPHQLVRADCLPWLKTAAEDPARFDLVFCDPPTFSNSKKMEDVLDVQRDHAGMIRDCVALLAPGGVLYFSTNRRSFKLDTAALADLEVRDITAQTLDEDFRRPPPAHKCWRITAIPG
ncbi:MAG TPA: bifunctional 23S rRNA (guanine(2069)-N(7))-methyltransferase RlmK/23S rRNA (guanine(2445)-N(2))-methyltransferase RlmL [Solimonas sp.]|nr:bifunctional 23S rRNA (guanine(2069)-N(7))-methyltransferase RlmK/23S rRNA (guanine(2445)-N(2))-methyltransferase RlmL [Solimonas sp.]